MTSTGCPDEGGAIVGSGFTELSTIDVDVAGFPNMFSPVKSLINNLKGVNAISRTFLNRSINPTSGLVAASRRKMNHNTTARIATKNNNKIINTTGDID
jgi:hypothetical protein